MILLAAFALLAGAATALSPCVLPVLPAALAAGATGGRRRPLGVVTGLWVSFTFATVALVYVIDALGLPDDLLRTLAIVVLIGFGLALVVPPLGARVEAWLSRLAPRAPGAQGQGFWSGVLLGAGLGLVYAPCAGPILAGVITVSAAQPFTAGRLLVALAYGAGSAAVLYGLMLGGRRVSAPLARRSGAFSVAMGAVMLVVAVAMLARWDTRFETAIASDLPSFLVDPARGVEDSAAARTRLAALRGDRRRGFDRPAARAAPAADLPVLGTAPDFTGTQRWFNTRGGRPLSLAGLRGRVVLVDFWTYSCINCLRTLPYLRAWDARYRAKGLTIVGVHTPEFPFERSASNVADAVAQNGIRYPVAQDNDQATWNAWGNQYWPAEYLVDARGRVRSAHFGEGEYTAKERDIRALLAEAGAGRLGGMTHARGESVVGAATPESYLGAARAERFVNGSLSPGERDFGALRGDPPDNGLAYGGRWTISPDAAQAGPGATLALTFTAKRVHLVLGSPGRPRPVSVRLDGRPLPDRLAGRDVRGGVARVDFQRLYRLVDLPRPGRHTLVLHFAPGVSGYAFTFG